MKLINWFISLFETKYQSNLESYISRRNPTCAAQVEHLEREYIRYYNRGLL